MSTLIKPKTPSKEASTESHVLGEARDRINGCSYRFVYNKINCHYEDGRLTLRGCVPSFYLKQVLQELMRGIDHVKQVINHVDVACTTGLSSKPQSKPR